MVEQDQPRSAIVCRIFLRYLDARIKFNAELERCALKGWPDRGASIRMATRGQERLLRRLAMRLSELAGREGPEAPRWEVYTSTLKVHKALEDYWTEADEISMRAKHPSYAANEAEIIRIRKSSDPEAVREPFEMAKRDPELVAAGWSLDRTVRDLDLELSALDSK